MTNLLRIFATALLASPLLFAQTQPTPAASAPQPGAGTINLPVTVRDKHGDIVSNLTKDDFTLTEDGRPQTIASVAPAADPVTVGLLVDTSIGQRNSLDSERSASQHFLDQMLTGSGNKAFLIQFDREVDLLVDISPDKAKLHAAIDQLGAPQFNNASSSGDSSDRIGSSASDTLYDAIYLASSQVIGKQPNRKALIVLTDGVDRGSKESLFSAIEAAQRANTMVYAIYFKGQEQQNNSNQYPGRRRGGMGYPGGYPGSGGGWPGGGGGGRPSRPTEGSRIDGRKVLEQICSETGGHMFEANKKASPDQIYSLIAGDLHGQYLLSYTPDKASTDSGFHRITLSAKKKDLYVQTRQGYYGE